MQRDVKIILCKVAVADVREKKKLLWNVSF